MSEVTFELKMDHENFYLPFIIGPVFYYIETIKIKRDKTVCGGWGKTYVTKIGKIVRKILVRKPGHLLACNIANANLIIWIQLVRS